METLIGQGVPKGVIFQRSRHEPHIICSFAANHSSKAAILLQCMILECMYLLRYLTFLTSKAQAQKIKTKASHRNLQNFRIFAIAYES